MIKQLVLLWTVSVLTLSIPFCQSERQLDKIVLTTTEKVEVEFSLYVQGFNLTYQLSEDNQTSVKLVGPLTGFSTSPLPCSGDVKQTFLVSGIETSDDGKWQGQFMVIIGRQTDICLSLGNINQKQEITFTVKQQFTDLDISSCLSVCKVSDYQWLVHCQNATSQMLYLYGIGQIDTYELPPTDSIVKSQIYNESGSILIIALTTSSIYIYSWEAEEGIIQLNRLNALYFNKSSLNLTDFVYTQKLVVSDYAEGCFRMDLDNGVVSNFENIHLGESVAIRIAGIGSEYFILSAHEILEIVWLQTHSIINIYQIQDAMSNIISMSVNHQLIILQSQTFDYIYRRGVTSLNNLLRKSPSQLSQKILLNPVFNTMIEINRYNMTLIRIGVGIIIYQNLTQNTDLYLIARSLDYTEQTCKVMLQLRICTDLDNIYPAIQKIQEVYLTTANTSITIPIGDCYYGLNLSYSAMSKSAVAYSFETHEPLKIYSAYANYQIIELIPIDGVNFMKISKQNNTYYIEICSESNLACLPQSHKTIGGTVSSFRLFTNSQLQFLMTYTLSNEPGSIYIESLYGNEFPTFKVTDSGGDLDIDDYTLSNQNIFVVRARLNKLEVYKLDFFNYPKVSTVDDQITKPQLFTPRQIHTNIKSSRNIYIKCTDRVLIVEYTTKVRLISTIYAKLRTIDDWDKWKFEVSSKSLIIIYSFNSVVEQYSILEPQSPAFLKNLPTSRMEFSDPIVSYMSSLGNLVILARTQFGNQLSIFKTGQPSIESLYTSIPIMGEHIVNIKGLDLQQLLLMYQDAEYHIYAERVHSKVSMILSTNFPMKEFITTQNIDIRVHTFKETVTVLSLLKIINYQEKISTESTNSVPIQLPSTADNIKLSFDPSKWFTGPVTNIQLLSNDQMGTSIVQIHQFDKFTQSKTIDKYYDIFNDGEHLWVLTQSQTIVVLDYALNPVRKSISGIPNTCKKFTKNSQIIFLFCVRQSNMKCITPILLYQNDVFIIRPDILYTSSWMPQNIIKANIVHDRLAILDNDIYGQGRGILYVYKIVKSKVSRDITLEHQRLLNPETFNMSKNATINDYQVLHLEDDLYYVYLTISTFGFVSGQVKFQEDITTGWTKIDLLNDSPKYMEKYQIQGNQVLQLRIIDTYQTNTGPQKQFHHIVMITTLYGAHLQLQMSYGFDNSTKSVEFKYSTFIEAFNTYYRQTRLNWLTAPAFNASKQNMFLTAYFNQSNFHITVVIYPLMSARPNQIPSSFPIFKEGVMFECYQPALISSVLIFKDDLTLFGWTPVCNDIFQVQSNKLLLYKLSTNISLIFNYRQSPRKVNQLRFHAVNDYSYADYLLSVKFQRPNQMRWWEILLICSSVFVVIFIVFCTIRKLRILKEKREDELFSSLMESISDSDKETKKDLGVSARHSQSQFVEEQLGGQIRGSIYSFGNDESRIDI